MAQPDWEEQVLRRSNIEKVFLTNDFDDPLEGFDTQRYVPCLRTDDLVFHLDKPEVRQRLAKATGIEVGDVAELAPGDDASCSSTSRGTGPRPAPFRCRRTSRRTPCRTIDFPSLAATADRPAPSRPCERSGVFWMLAEHCREFELPFDLMIGVNRRVYREGVYQGQDLFDQRTSLIQYAELFNAFPEVTFCVSVLSSGQNQELVSYSWIFPNVVTSGHWWYSNIPGLHRARLPGPAAGGAEDEADRLLQRHVQAGVRPAQVQHVPPHPGADPGRRLRAPACLHRDAGPGLARLLLRDNVRRIFNV